MDSGTIGLIILAGLAIGSCVFVFKFFGFMRRKHAGDYLRGRLREDYLRNHPECLSNGRAVCCHDGCQSIFLWVDRSWGPPPNAVNEHKCTQCGRVLYYSVNGSYLEKIVKQLEMERTEQNSPRVFG